MTRKLKPKKTDKQKEIMGIILREAGAGRFLTLSELYPLLSYKSEATYGAVRLSVRNLEEKGFIHKNRVGVSKQLIPTPRAYDWFIPKMS